MPLSTVTVTGFIDEATNTILPNNAATWAEYSGTTWANWTAWTGTPADPLVWITDILDLGTVQTFNLNIETQATGTVSYTVFVSDTGAFAGEESETQINPGDTNIASFSGQFVAVAVSVAADSGPTVIETMSLRTNNQTLSLKFSDIDTSTLPGTVDARVLESDRAISGILNMLITPKEVVDYSVDAYVTNTPTSKTVVPRIVDKSQLTFALVGVDNQPRDAVVDIVVEALPLQSMSGNNLRTS